MRVIFNIIYFKLLAFSKFDEKLSLTSIFKSALSSIVYIGFAIGGYIFTQKIIEFLLVEVKIGQFLLHQFLSIILFIFFIAVNVGNILVSYSTLFKSDEITFLLSKPLPPIKIFIIKFLDNFFYSSGTLLMMITTVLIGYVTYFNLGIVNFVVVLLFGFLPFILIAGLTGVLILFLVIRTAITFGLKKVIGSLVFFYLASMFIFFKVTSPVTLVNQVMQYYPNVDRYFGEIIPGAIKYLPNNWLSESLYWISSGEPAAAIKYFGFLIVLMVILLIITLFVARKYYYSSWLSALKFKNGGAALKRDSIILDFRKHSSRNLILDSIIKRDFHLFFREPSQVFHLAVLLLLIVIFISSIGSTIKLGAGTVTLQALIYLVVMIFNVLLISTLSLRFVFPITSLEGYEFWKVLTSPVKRENFIKARLFYPFLFIIILAIIMTVISISRFSFQLVPSSLLIMTGVVISQFLMNFGMGCLFVKYNEKNPIRISSSQGASLTFLLSLVYMVFLIIILFNPTKLYFIKKMSGGVEYLGGLNLAAIIIFSISLIIGTAFYKLGIRKLREDF